MTAITQYFTRIISNKSVTFLLLLLFAMAPFQKRFHGAVDSFSRKLTLPDFPLPQFFSTKAHLFIADPFILLLALVLLIRFRVPLREFFFQGPSKYLTLLFFASLASIYFSITSTYALQYLRLAQFSMVFLLFSAVSTMAYAIDLSHFVRRLAYLTLCIAALQCVIGILQYFTQGPIGLEFLGEINIHHFPFANPGKHRWLFDHILPTSHSSEYLYRSSGTFTHPNVLGGFLFCGLMAAYYLWMKEDSPRKRVFILTTTILQVFTLYTSYSRSAMIALVLATLFWCFLQFKHKTSQSKRLKILFSVLIVSALAGIGLFYSQMSARGGIVNYNHVTQFADSERIHYLKIAARMVEAHPWFGVGFNNFQLCVENFQPENTPHHFFAKVHNIYLLIAAETGLIGAALFLLFLISLGKTAWKALFPAQELAQERFFLAAVFLGLLWIGVCDFYFLNTQHGRMLFFGFLGVLYAVCKNSGPRPIQE